LIKAKLNRNIFSIQNAKFLKKIKQRLIDRPVFLPKTEKESLSSYSIAKYIKPILNKLKKL